MILSCLYIYRESERESERERKRMGEGEIARSRGFGIGRRVVTLPKPGYKILKMAVKSPTPSDTFTKDTLKYQKLLTQILKDV